MINMIIVTVAMGFRMSGISVHTEAVQFSSMEACRAAAESIKAIETTKLKVSTICVRK